jgi:hypothetical protein
MGQSIAFKTDGVWAEWCTRSLTRQSSGSGKLETLDPGVNFFVEALEAAGATTQFSCEGHPNGFYVAFFSDYDLALRVHAAGFFEIEFVHVGYWCIRLKTLSTEDDFAKRRALNWAADAWVKAGLTPVELQDGQKPTWFNRDSKRLCF